MSNLATAFGFAIVSGEYSDYCVHAVFSAEAAADECIALFGSGFRKEPMAIDPDLTQLRNGLQVWNVSVEEGRWNAEREQPHVAFYVHEVDELIEFGKKVGLEVRVLADTEERALKAGMERIRQHRALAGVTYADQEQEEEAARKRVLDLQKQYEREAAIRKEEQAQKSHRAYLEGLAMQKVGDGYQESERDIDARLDKQFKEQMEEFKKSL